MACNEPHPEHRNLRCISTTTHAEHVAFLGPQREPIDWPNEDFIPARPKERSRAGAAGMMLKDLADRVPSRQRSVDADVIAIGHDHPETSKDMARKVVGKTGTQRRAVYTLALARGEVGVSDDEIEIALDMLHQSASAARNSLMNDGWLVDTGVRRPTRRGHDAICWVAISE